MSETLYPNSYGAPDRTMATIEARTTIRGLNPEVWRRFRALMIFAASQGVGLGPGTGWRVQPVNPDGTAVPNHALPGNSNHESFPVGAGPRGGDAGAVAIDAVGDLAFMEKHAAAYGLRSFRRPSTWGYKGKEDSPHVQPVEIPAARSYRKTPWELPRFPLPNVGPPPPPPPPPGDLITLAPPPPLQPGSNPSDVRWLQTLMNQRWNTGLKTDGIYGPATTAAVKVMQSALGGLTIDGGYGPKTGLALEAWLAKQAA